jgi:hypothetical protein
LILALLLLCPGRTIAAESADRAVIAIGRCDSPETPIYTRAFRAALAQKLDGKLQSESETAKPLGGLAERSPLEVEFSIREARSEWYKGDEQQAIEALEKALQDAACFAPSDARWKLERDATAMLANIKLKRDRPAAEKLLAHLYAVDPELKLDPVLYSPSFQKFAKGVLASVAARPSHRLDVVVSPPAREVYVGGKRFGPAPLSAWLVEGTYQIEVDWGYRGLARSVDTRDASVELAASVEGAIAPDAGPCIDRGTLEASMNEAKRIGVTHFYALRLEVEGASRVLVGMEWNGNPASVRQVRVPLQTGAPVGEALSTLATALLSGNAAVTTPRFSQLSAPERRRMQELVIRDRGPEVLLLKKRVITFEPIYAGVLHAELHGDGTSDASTFEVRPPGQSEWNECVNGVPPRTYDPLAPLAGEAQFPPMDIRLPCGINTVGTWQVRLRGQPVDVEVVQPPPSEAQVVRLLATAPERPLDPAMFHGPLAESIYAGYAMADDVLRAGALRSPLELERVQMRQEARTLSGSARQTSLALVDEYAAQLRAHPDFIFRDVLRLKIASTFMELGQCDQARRWLTEVEQGKEFGIARRFLRELGEAKALCRSSGR